MGGRAQTSRLHYSERSGNQICLVVDTELSIHNHVQDEKVELSEMESCLPPKKTRLGSTRRSSILINERDLIHEADFNGE